MKEVYNHYELHFLKLNFPNKEAFESAAKAYAAWYKKFLPADKNVKILDIGCGIGHFLYFLKKEGYTNFFGIDLSRRQVDFIRENITKNVAVADAFDFLRVAKEPFQLIVMNDILEHIPKKRLLEFLHLIYNSLDKKGMVFIKVPNMSNPFGLRSRYISITHELGFTEHSLLEVLEIVGFQDIHMIGTFSLLISVKSLIVKIGRVIIHKFLRLIFLVQGYPPPKVLDPNIIAIAKKK